VWGRVSDPSRPEGPRIFWLHELRHTHMERGGFLEPLDKGEYITGMPDFVNYYRCPNDGTEWADAWSCMSNDKCPSCNAEIEPYRSDDIGVPPST